MKKKKYISRDEALDKLERYCVYQDRCHKEVRTKLIELGIYGDDLELIIAKLIEENFLNEERYACSYVRGKFRMKKWGRIKIKIELKRNKISAYCIKKGFQEIDEEEYIETLDKLILKKNELLREKNPYKRNQKIAAYLYQKGYESHLIWERIKALIKFKK